MKKKFYSIWCFVISCSMLFTACSVDDDGEKKMTDQQIATHALAEGSPWSVKEVVSKPDGTDAELLDDFQISFGETAGEPGSFSSTSSDPNLVGEPGATWKWADNGISTISLKKAFTAELTNVTYAPGIESPSTITLTFALTAEGGRKKGLGEYTVTFE